MAEIVFGRTAYVPAGPEMLDAMSDIGLHICMTGDGLVCTTHESIEEHISDMEESFEVLKVRNTARKNLPTLIGGLKSERALTCLEKRLKDPKYKEPHPFPSHRTLVAEEFLEDAFNAINSQNPGDSIGDVVFFKK